MTLQDYANQLQKQWLSGNYRVTQMPGAAAASTRKFYSTHKGYDFATPEGTQIKSPIAGKVVYSGYDNTGWGNRIGIYDPKTNKTTYLSHLSKYMVKPGQQINAGDLIAMTGGRPGTSGAGNTTGAHLDITEYLGNKIFKPAVSGVNRMASNVGRMNYSQILKNIMSKYGKNKRVIAISSDPNKLKKLGRGQIVKINM